MEINDLKGLYIAHRGIHNDRIVENTISAFSLALEKKVPIELDVRILNDGNLVVYHDENLKRLMGIDNKLSDYTYEQLKNITFLNDNAHIPLLQDVLNLVSGRVLLVIEIKYCDNYSYKDYCKKVVSVLKNYSGNFVIKSFDIRIVYWFLKNTDYITGLLLNGTNKSFYDWVSSRISIISILKPDFLSVNYRIVSSTMVQKFRKKRPILVWTINNETLLDKVMTKADSFLIEKFYF